MPISMKQMKKKLDQIPAEESLTESNHAKNADNASHDIAVIGLACQFSIADNAEEFWEMLKRGTDGIHSYPADRKKYGDEFLNHQVKYPKDSGYYEGGFLNEVDKFDNEVFKINNLDVSLMSPEQRNFLQVAWKAMEDAGYGGDRTRGSDVGVFIGNSVDFGVPYKEFIDVLNPDLSSTSISGNLNGIIASRISFINDWNGPALNFDTACSSSLTALHHACMSLRAGECSMAIAGSAKIDNLPLKAIKSKEDLLGITSEDGRTKTFDESSDGTGLGEGVGAIVLKRLSQAIQDRDHICAVIKGSAINHDGQSANLTAPNPVAQANVIVRAWKDAKIKPETISYIEAHGTATKLGDPIEINGITEAFRKFTDKKQFCAIGSVKSNIGHLDHAAGIAGVIKLILCLEHKKLVPSIHYHAPNKNINFGSSPVYVNTEYKDWESKDGPRRCGISAFGLSGTNCHIVLEEAPEICKKAMPMQDYHILTLSANSVQRLMEYVWSYQKYLYQHPNVNLYDLCHTANAGRNQYTSRLAIVFRDIEELQDKLELAAIRSFQNMEKEDVYYGTFHVISDEQKVKADCDITISEKSEYTKSAAEVLNEDKFGKKQLSGIAKYYCKGASIDWNLFYHGTRGNAGQIRIPTYPYAKKRFWVEASKKIKEKEESEMNNNNHSDASIQILGDNTFSENETAIAQIIGTVLGLSEINIYQSFTELGGNSIVAIKAEMDLNKNGYAISLAALLSTQSIRQLASLTDSDVVQDANESPDKKEKLEEIIEMETVIEGIEPFTELIYKGCFYSSLIPVLKKYNRNILHAVTNDLLLFGFNEEGNPLSFTIQYVQRKSIDKLLSDMNIICNSKARSENIIADLMHSIGSGKPVIICIDCFYSSIREDKYQTEHWPHNILVYGFHEKEQIFQIIEHVNSESTAYKKMTIGFEDLKNSYEGYFESFANLDIVSSNLYDSIYKDDIELPTYFEFAPAASPVPIPVELEQDQIRKDQLTFMKDNFDQIEQSYNNLHLFVQAFTSWVEQEELIKENADTIIMILNKIANRCIVLQFQQKYLYAENKEANEAVNELYVCWDKVRNLFVKYYYSHMYSSSWTSKIKERIAEAYELETRLFNMEKGVV